MVKFIVFEFESGEIHFFLAFHWILERKKYALSTEPRRQLINKDTAALFSFTFICGFSSEQESFFRQPIARMRQTISREAQKTIPAYEGLQKGTVGSDVIFLNNTFNKQELQKSTRFLGFLSYPSPS